VWAAVDESGGGGDVAVEESGGGGDVAVDESVAAVTWRSTRA
jgi:hypothetical protein